MSTAPPHGPPRRAFGWGSFGYWLVLGALLTLAVVGIMSIGLYALIAALIMIIWAMFRRISTRTLPAVFIGAGITPMYVAALHRRGPGMVCTESPTGHACTDFLDPAPFAGVGAGLILLGVLILLIAQLRRRRAGAQRFEAP